MIRNNPHEAKLRKFSGRLLPVISLHLLTSKPEQHSLSVEGKQIRWPKGKELHEYNPASATGRPTQLEQAAAIFSDGFSIFFNGLSLITGSR